MTSSAAEGSVVLSREGARLQVFLDLRSRCIQRRGPEEIVICDEYTIERPWGWVFFYTTQGMRDGDYNYAIAGNRPYMVNRDGSFFHAPDRSVEKSIRLYEDELERRAGTWELFVEEPADCPLAIASGLRSALGLSVVELGTLRRRLPAVIASGAAVDLEPSRARLVAAGVRAVVRLSGQSRHAS